MSTVHDALWMLQAVDNSPHSLTAFMLDMYMRAPQLNGKRSKRLIARPIFGDTHGRGSKRGYVHAVMQHSQYRSLR